MMTSLPRLYSKKHVCCAPPSRPWWSASTPRPRRRRRRGRHSARRRAAQVRPVLEGPPKHSGLRRRGPRVAARRQPPPPAAAAVDEPPPADPDDADPSASEAPPILDGPEPLAAAPSAGLDDDVDEDEASKQTTTVARVERSTRASSNRDAGGSSSSAGGGPAPDDGDDDREDWQSRRRRAASQRGVISAKVPGDGDFERLSVLGVGSFGRVVLCRYRGDRYAVKLVAYTKLTNPKHLERTLVERDVLAETLEAGHAHVVDLVFAYRTPYHFALVFEFCPGGELFHQLAKYRTLDAKTSAFYAAELLLALDHAHSRGVVYRDVKPENCLLDDRGHLKLADFGLAKRDVFHRFEGAHSVCGTLEYMAPDVLVKAVRGYGTAVDLWGLGIWTYELLTGHPPWRATDKKKLFRDIRFANLRIPPSMPISAAVFVAQLVRRHPRDRLTDAAALKTHTFFSENGYDLETISTHADPPLDPCGRLRGCRRRQPEYYNFDLKFARLPVADQPDEVTPAEDQQLTAADDVPGWDFARQDEPPEEIVVVNGENVVVPS
mmetsp:Transcript_14799/g.59258  ORF Transcript_14799/g.59258 Transcript_14799/m.59258 type:complete len:549 (-) Transcript_14799:172-1818(-)